MRVRIRKNGGCTMAKYKKMYLKLFNAATDAIRFIDADEPENAKARLIAAQQAAEEIYHYLKGTSKE